MEGTFLPRVIGFLCNWCAYAGADLAGVSRLQMPPSLRTIRVMCSSRVNPLFIIRAFLMGADGILVAGCHPGDCHYLKGNYHARRRFTMLKRTFESIGLEADRLRLSWISAGEGPRFQEVITEFTEKIRKIGPNLAKEEIFL